MTEMTKKEALQMLRDAVYLPRVSGRIETIRAAFEASMEIIERPWWKRFFQRIFSK